MNTAKYAVEFMGTFLFISVILGTSEPIPIAVALLAAIYFGSAVSGGFFNPAVTLVKVLDGTLTTNDAILYTSAQLLGGYCAYIFYTKIVKPSSTI